MLLTKEYSNGELILQRYKILEIIKGGMGIVFVCIDSEADTIVALKSFQSEFIVNPSSKKALENEAYIWISIPWHINIVRAYGIIFENNIPFIVMEYIPSNNEFGNNLRDYLGHNYFSLKEKQEIIIQIVNGLNHIEKIGSFVHRDLKPENILISPEGIVKITDFGISKIQTLNVNQFKTPLPKSFNQSSIVGTPYYMAPEQLLLDEIDKRSDIYSLGLIMVELFTKIHPYNLVRNSYDNLYDLIANFKLDTRLLDEFELPQVLVNIIVKCLEKDKRKRFDNYSDLLKMLNNAYISLTGTHFTKNSKIEGAENYWNLLLKANSLRELGFYEEAEKFFLECETDCSSLYYHNLGLAILYYNTKDFAKSNTFYNKALELKQDDPIIYNNYGISLVDQENYKLAKIQFLKAVEINPNYFRAYTNLSLISEKDGDIKQAKEYCVEALKVSPNSDKANYNLSYYHLLSYDYHNSLEYANRTIKINPNYFKAYLNKAICHHNRFENELAKHSIEIAHQLAPLNSQIDYWYKKIIE